MKELPMLGICLGGQLLAHVLGGRVGPGEQAEIGWYPLHPTAATPDDKLLAPLIEPHPIFQWHHWGFDCPPDAISVADNPDSGCQAFRAGESAWGFQFHLELDRRLIHRWLTLPFYRNDSQRFRPGPNPGPDRSRHRPVPPRHPEAGRQGLRRLAEPARHPPGQRIVLGSR